MSIKINASNGLETLEFLSVSCPASARHRVEQAPAILQSTTKEISVCQSCAWSGFWAKAWAAEFWFPCLESVSLRMEFVPAIAKAKACPEKDEASGLGWSSARCAFSSYHLFSFTSHSNFPNFPRLISGTSRLVSICSSPSGASRWCLLIHGK